VGGGGAWNIAVTPFFPQWRGAGYDGRVRQEDRRELLRWCLRAAAALVALGAILGAALTESACLPDGRPCSPGDYMECTCSGGAAGASRCDPQGSAYGACDCTILVDAAPEAAAIDGAADTGALDASAGDGSPCNVATNRPIFCPCTDNGQCADGVCHTYNGRGQL